MSVVVVSVVATEDGLLMCKRFYDAGEDVADSTHTLPMGEKYMDVPFAEWERHAGTTVWVSEHLSLLPVTPQP